MYWYNKTLESIIVLAIDNDSIPLSPFVEKVWGKKVKPYC